MDLGTFILGAMLGVIAGMFLGLWAVRSSDRHWMAKSELYKRQRDHLEEDNKDLRARLFQEGRNASAALSTDYDPDGIFGPAE